MTPSFVKGTVPRHMQIAYSLIGTKEIIGGKDNKVILDWAKGLGLERIYKTTKTPWCGLFFAHVMKEANRRVDLSTKDPYDYLRALKYVNMPNVTKVPKGQEMFGDILIFQRPSGGHIGFYSSENENSFSVLGGNQGNSVNLVNIAKNRLIACLRPNYISFQPSKYIIASNGKLSTNEA